MANKSKRMDVFALIERENDKTFWLKIGSAFTNKDQSINVYLDAVPLSGKIQIREPSAKEEGDNKGKE